MSTSIKKTAIVTGASSGIGLALAKHLHSKGIEVFAGARRLEPMQPLKELGVHIYKLDVTSDESIAAFKLEVEKLCGDRIDFLFNNAGQPCVYPGAEVPIEVVNQCFDVNFNGVVRMVKAFVPLVINAKGKIVQTGSVTGDIPFPWGSIYGASKAAVKSYSEVLRLELAPFGVDVVTIVTGGVATNIGDTRGLPENTMFGDAKVSFEARRKMSKNSHPMSAETYAAKVFAQVDVGRAPETIWQGTMAGILYYATTYLPRWIFLRIILQKFYMYNYYAKVRARLAKEKDD